MKTNRIYSRNSLTLIAVLCATVLGAAVLGACSGPWDSGNGTIRINLGGGARSIEVTDEMKAAMVFDISLTKGEELVEQTSKHGEPAASFTVAPGAYKITILAYLNADHEKDNPFATGNKPVNVTAGKTSHVTITMKQAEKDGDIDVDITWPDDILEEGGE